MTLDFKPSYDEHIFLDFEVRKSLIRRHKEAAEKGDTDAMKKIEFALNDSDTLSDGDLCKSGKYDTALELIERKEVLFRSCSTGTINLTDLDVYMDSGMSLQELKAELQKRSRERK